MCWADFRHLLKSNDFKGEKELWLDLIQKQKVLLTSGESCFTQTPGFYRICFAYPYVGEKDDVTEAMQELKTRLVKWDTERQLIMR